MNSSAATKITNFVRSRTLLENSCYNLLSTGEKLEHHRRVKKTQYYKCCSNLSVHTFKSTFYTCYTQTLWRKVYGTIYDIVNHQRLSH